MSWEGLRATLKRLEGSNVSDEFSLLSLGDTRKLLAERDYLESAMNVIRKTGELNSADTVAALMQKYGSDAVLMRASESTCVTCGKLDHVNRAGWCFNCFTAPSLR